MSDKIVNHFVLADGSTAKYSAGGLLNLDDTVSLAGYAPDAKAVGDRLTDVEMLTKTFVTPEMFGAKGDGIIDDTTAIQNMFDETENDVLYFPNKYLITGAIMSNKPRDIIGGGMGSYIHASTSTSVFEFEKAQDDINDYRNNFIKNLNVYQNGTGNAVSFSDWGDHLASLLLENCKFYAYNSANGYGLYCSNSLAHSYILNCQFRGNGAYLNCRDANVLEKCLFWGQGNGIVLKPAVYGCLNNAVKDCTIVNTVGNAIQLIDAEQVLIQNNQIEYANSNDAQTATLKGLVVLFSEDENRHCENIVIKNNNFGGSTAITNQIIVDDAQDTYISNNRFANLTGSNINITVNSKRTVVNPDNYRTTNNGVISDLVVTADGEVLEFPYRVTNSGITTITLIKKRNGYVVLRYFNLLQGVTQIATLPTWAVNSGYQTKITAMAPNNEYYTVYINPAGVVSLSAPGGSPNIQTGLYFPLGEFYAGFTY